MEPRLNSIQRSISKVVQPDPLLRILNINIPQACIESSDGSLINIHGPKDDPQSTQRIVELLRTELRKHGLNYSLCLEGVVQVVGSENFLYGVRIRLEGIAEHSTK